MGKKKAASSGSDSDEPVRSAEPGEAAPEAAAEAKRIAAYKKAHSDEWHKELKARFTASSLATKEMFLNNYGVLPTVDRPSQQLLLATKIADEYEAVKALETKEATDGPKKKKQKLAPPPVPLLAPAEAAAAAAAKTPSDSETVGELIESLPDRPAARDVSSTALIAFKQAEALPEDYSSKTALILKQRALMRIKPEWHAPWKLMRVISGHLGWVRAVTVDHSNEWFATGSNDRTIKIWDLASGTLKLTLTGHISSVRGLQISKRHPYLFSVSEDKTVKCWDLEYNKVVRSYHGHLSAVYVCNLHPTVDVLMTGGRDSAVRVWDIRTKTEVRVLSGHINTIGDIASQGVDPQIISGSHDSQIKLWDLAQGTCITTLTNHKKSVRALRIHHSEYTFLSGAADNLKVWKCPEGKFLRNLSGHNTIVNALAINQDNVTVSGGDNGSIHLFDWKTGYNFQQIQSQVQPGSLDSEAGINALEFDHTGSRLISCETDKTIKIWKEDETATEESHPVNYKPPKKLARH